MKQKNIHHASQSVCTGRMYLCMYRHIQRGGIKLSYVTIYFRYWLSTIYILSNIHEWKPYQTRDCYKKLMARWQAWNYKQCRLIMSYFYTSIHVYTVAIILFSELFYTVESHKHLQQNLLISYSLSAIRLAPQSRIYSLRMQPLTYSAARHTLYTREWMSQKKKKKKKKVRWRDGSDNEWLQKNWGTKWKVAIIILQHRIYCGSY